MELVNAVVLSPIHGLVPTLVQIFTLSLCGPHGHVMIITNAHMHLGKCSSSFYPLMVKEGAYLSSHREEWGKIHEQETKMFVTK